MARVLFLVDGFYLYHILDDRSNRHKYKWLDYSKLAHCFLTEGDKIAGILWFTAYAEWKPSKVERHKTLIKAQPPDVEVITSRFKFKEKTCRYCHKVFEVPEEKQTDVSFGVRLLRAAHFDEFDRALLVTGDSDMVPAIKVVKETFPKKRIGVVIPLDASAAHELKNVADFWLQMKPKHLRRSQLDEVVVTDTGEKLERPPSWR